MPEYSSSDDENVMVLTGKEPLMERHTLKYTLSTVRGHSKSQGNEEAK